MARARSERARSKLSPIEDLTQSIEQLQAFLLKVEDLGREGFPYLEGARARTELQLRECIKRAFGDKSPEFQAHRHHRLSVLSDSKQTVSLIRDLIAMLENKKLELQGLKPTVAGETTTVSEPTRPHMTLVPPSAPTAQVTITSAAPTTPPQAKLTVPLATNAELSASVSTPVAVPPIATPTPPSSTVPVAPPQPVTQPIQPKPQRGPIEPISSLFRTQEIKPLAPTTEQVQQPASPALTPVAASEPTPPSANPIAPPQAIPPRFSTTQEVPARPQSTAPSMPSTTQASVVRAAASAETDHLNITKKLCQRFHFVARQLRLRGEYRSTLDVEDEFDVQDLLHALLRLQFDDISTDEWTPSYTSGAPRTTFLLNHDGLAIIVKKTRTGLSAKDLSDQVRVDSERYRARGRCTNLFCFIYDPEGRIGNPRGLESELASTSEHFTVDVLIAPK
jgi:hypothetical protein